MRPSVGTAVAALALLLAFLLDGQTQVAGAVKIPTDKSTLQAVALGYRASKTIHTSVYNVSGNKLGRVDGIILTPSYGASYFIIDVARVFPQPVKARLWQTAEAGLRRRDPNRALDRRAQ